MTGDELANCAADASSRPIRDAESTDAVERREVDARLAAAAAAGDDAAFERIVAEHGPRVLRMATRMLGDRAEAEDLLQDVLVRVHRSLGRFRGEASLATWISRIAVNATRNRVRDARRKRRHLTDSLDAPAHDAIDGDAPSRAERLASDAPGPERLALSGEASRLVEDALAALPSEFREVVVLRDVEQLSYAAIAQATGLEPGTVKSRIARGRQRLQLALGAVHRSRDEAGGAT